MNGDPWNACKPFIPPPHVSPTPFPHTCPPAMAQYTHPLCPITTENHHFPPFWGWFITIFPLGFPKATHLDTLSPISPYFPCIGIVFRQGSGSGNFWALHMTSKALWFPLFVLLLQVTLKVMDPKIYRNLFALVTISFLIASSFFFLFPCPPVLSRSCVYMFLAFKPVC